MNSIRLQKHCVMSMCQEFTIGVITDENGGRCGKQLNNIQGFLRRTFWDDYKMFLQELVTCIT